jgi:glycosyltransferase involved in cell wall biosynthesis
MTCEVSVILPYFNAENTLAAAVKSVLSQNFSRIKSHRNIVFIFGFNQ